MEVTMEKAGKLYFMIPIAILQHFADQKKVSTFDICEMIVEQNPSWVNRLFDNETSYCLNDLKHDVVGLIANDEHFIPRI
jgi:hypothetical protein